MKRLLALAACLVALTGASAFAASTSSVPLSTAAYADLGAGPIYLGASGGAVVFQIADSQPSATAPGLIEQAGAAPVLVSTSSHVWALAGNAGASAVVAPAASGGSVTVSGAAAIATAQAAPTTTATLIVAARTGAAGTGRVAATVFNSGSTTIFLGASGVTTSTGLPLLPGASLTLNTTAAIYGITSSGTGAVSAVETF